jgi:hypothetical protein
VATLALAVTLTTSTASAWPGCDPARPAVAHTAGGTALAHQPDNPPIPCESVVGQTSESADVGVSRSGAVFFAPLNENTSPPPQNVLKGPEWVVRSKNNGRTWSILESGGPTTGGLVPPWMSVDPRTSRIWFATTLPTLCGARISWSDDDGRTWETNPSVGCPAQGGEKLLEGPPPRSGASPKGYPHVVYYCANGSDVVASMVYCYRSLDGGQSFDAVDSSPDPKLPPGCDERHPARVGAVGTDGALYFPTQVCGKLGIAISRDEGDTWHHRKIATTEIEDIYTASTAVDKQGNIYIVFTGPGELPYLTISRDHGSTWTKPTKVVAPHVTQVRRVAITARRRGHIALAYQGTTHGKFFDGYITESANALAKKPSFWSATVNDPAEPMVNGADEQSFGNRFFYGTAAFARDANLWAGFQCARTVACPGVRVGIAGRLVPPSNRFRLGKPVIAKRKGTARLPVKTPGPGKLVLRGSKLKKTKRKAPRKEGITRLRIRPKGKARGSLRRNGKLKTKARVTFTPTAGAPRTKKRRVKLVYRCAGPGRRPLLPSASTKRNQP